MLEVIDKSAVRHGKRWILTRKLADVLRVRSNGLHGGTRLLKTASSLQEWRDLLADLEPDVVYGEGGSRTAGLALQRPREEVV